MPKAGCRVGIRGFDFACVTSDEVKSDKTATTHLFAFDSSLVSLLQIGWFAVTVGAERNVVESREEDVFETA